MKIILTIIGALTPLGAWFKIATFGLSPALLLFPIIIIDVLIKSKIRLPSGLFNFWYQTFLFWTTISFIVNLSDVNNYQIVNFVFYFLIIIAIESMNISRVDLLNYFKAYINSLFTICLLCLFSMLGIVNPLIISETPLFINENDINVIYGSEDNPGAFAFHLIMAVPFAAYLVRASNGLNRYKYLTQLIVLVGCLCLTFSRGAIIGLIVALSVSFIIQNQKKSLTLAKIIIFCAVIATSWIFYTMLVDGVSSKVLRNKKISEDVRIYVLEKSIEAISKNPLFGIGAERFKVDYVDQEVNSSHSVESSHNSYINIAVAYGLPASISFLAITMFMLFNSKLTTKNEVNYLRLYSALWVSVTAMAIDGLFHDNYVNSGYWTSVGFLIKFSRPLRNEQN